MRKIWIEFPAALGLVLGLVPAFFLAGCATTQDDLLNRDSETMREVWNRETGGGQAGHMGRQLLGRQLLDARQVLRRPLTEADRDAAVRDTVRYTRDAQNEIHRQFHRLPNPELALYVFPHLSGSDPVPVPGYSTVFPLYRRAPYALPGERTEEY
jgi:conjugative transfer region lipoprotein (TIGR03751 family)